MSLIIEGNTLALVLYLWTLVVMLCIFHSTERITSVKEFFTVFVLLGVFWPVLPLTFLLRCIIDRRFL